MPLSREVRRLGGRWPALIERVEIFAAAMPDEGMPLGAFGEAALADVDPHDVVGTVRALAGRGAIWLRQARGEVRVFAKRPPSIVGLIGGPNPAETCLADCVPHLCAATDALARRDKAKATGDYLDASAARDLLRVACTRLVKTVRKHVDRGLSLEAFRKCLWVNWVPGTLETLVLFEPALAFGSDADLPSVEASPRRRITAGLSSIEKVAALVGKAGEEGMTKTDLRRAIKPKLNGDELDELLDRLADEGRIEPREVRIKVTGKPGVRYFAREARRAAEAGSAAEASIAGARAPRRLAARLRGDARRSDERGRAEGAPEDHGSFRGRVGGG